MTPGGRRYQQLTGAWDYKERLNMLARDGIAAEVIFPDGITEKNTPPFGAGLGLSPRDVVPELQWAGAMAHNRWLAQLCANDPAAISGWPLSRCCGMCNRRWTRCAGAWTTACARS